MFTNWTVLHTHPRAEKKAAEDCTVLGIEYYLPLRSATRIYQRRKVTFQLPLFPGYLFLNLPPEKRIALISRHHAVRLLPVSRPIKMLRQLVMIRKALALDPSIDAINPIKCGEVVRISTGPMQGCEGVVAQIRRKGNTVLLLLSVDIIGRAVPIEIERTLIERR